MKSSRDLIMLVMGALIAGVIGYVSNVLQYNYESEAQIRKQYVDAFFDNSVQLRSAIALLTWPIAGGQLPPKGAVEEIRKEIIEQDTALDRVRPLLTDKEALEAVRHYKQLLGTMSEGLQTFVSPETMNPFAQSAVDLFATEQQLMPFLNEIAKSPTASFKPNKTGKS